MSQTQKVLSLNGRKITLLGTAHISNESIEEVAETIRSQKPDCVAIELDEKRRESMTETDTYRKLDIIAVLKRKEGFLLLANLVLASFQRRMGQNVGVKPGDEMLAAMNTAKEEGIPSVMVDRPIAVTLRRAWAKNSFWGKCKLISAMIASAFDKEEVSSEQIEALKKSNEMDSMMRELSDYLPAVKEVLIDERDRYLACHIWNAAGNNVLAVLGAGHLPGVQDHIEKIAEGEESTDTTAISEIPQKEGFSKYTGWIIPVLIIALIILGFIFGGRNTGRTMVGSWIIWNGMLAAIGTLIAAGHPITVLVAFIGAPLTSLCPFIGVGVLTGIVQAVFCKPKVSDMETLQDDVASFKGWYQNKILRVLLVFLLSSIGSSIGTFVAGAGIIKTLSRFFSKIGIWFINLFAK
ncbi:MAG: TraB/GumN family protein [Treponema sp.]|nr:TraB/GumN family protein [Treponema sp.]